MVCTDIVFPLSKGGNGNTIKRYELESSKSWVIATLRRHHKQENDRPYCLCSPNKPKMQVHEHRNGKLYLKRLPNTGSMHHKDCPSFGDTVSSKKRNYKDAVYTEGGFYNICSSSSIGVPHGARAPKGEQGGSQRTGTARHRLTLTDTFHAIWSEAGLDTRIEDERPHYELLKNELDNTAKNIKINGTLLSDVLFIPNQLTDKQQQELLASKLKDNDSKKKLVVMGLLNKLNHQPKKEGGFSKFLLFLYNGYKATPKATAPLILDEGLYKYCQKKMNFKGDVWEFNRANDLVWVIATVEVKTRVNSGGVYGKVSNLAFIPVSSEHVPI
ncbi:DUF1173 family protein [Marinomonas gallaica]|uniref:DUF1173 family protein n=1 Tax=Marinomonas gallaica TaxID=1806667 RepID=UPI000833D415|nr:DUF1173 family protein [Marinomonas gallaica]